MKELISTKQLTDRLESIREERMVLEEEEGHLRFVIDRFSKKTKPKTPDWPYNLGIVNGTVEVLRKEAGWLSGPEICALFLSGGWQSTSSNPINVLVSTLNGEIRIKRTKGERPRIIKQAAKYGLPDPEWQKKAGAVHSSLPL